MRNLKITVLLTFLSVFTVSCLNDTVIVNETGGFVAFTNASPGSEPLKLYLNDSPFGGVATSYGGFLRHRRVAEGNTTISVRTETSTDLDVTSLDIQNNSVYGVYAVNEFGSLDLAIYDESHTIPLNNNRTTFRFMQLSPNTPKVRLAVEGNSTDFGSFNYKDASEFFETGLITSRKFYLIDDATSDTLLTKTLTLLGRQSYVVFSKGLLGSSDENLKLDLQMNQF